MYCGKQRYAFELYQQRFAGTGREPCASDEDGRVPSLPHGKVLEEKVQHHRRRHQGLQKKQTGFCICTGMLFEKVDRETFEFTGYSGPGIRCDTVSREYAGYQKPKPGAVPVSVREAVEPANPSANSVFVYGKGRGISQRKAESVPELFLFF